MISSVQFSSVQFSHLPTLEGLETVHLSSLTHLSTFEGLETLHFSSLAYLATFEVGLLSYDT